MRYAIVFGLVAAALSGRATAQERGILPFKAMIVKIHEKCLELALVDRSESIPRGLSIRFDVAKDTRFEDVDFQFVDGRLQTTRKAIALADLLPTQTIYVIALVAGDRRIILFGVVAGETASGAETLKQIASLGGKVRNFAWKKGETQYEVDLSNSKVTDDAVALIALTDDLVVLNLSNTKITDQGIAHPANHARLAEIMLSGTRVTNDVLTPLSTLPTLNQVLVDQTAVSRDAIIRFAKKKRGLRSFCQISAGPKCEYRVHEVLRADRGAPVPYVYLMKRDVYYGRFYAEEPAQAKSDDVLPPRRTGWSRSAAIRMVSAERVS